MSKALVSITFALLAFASSCHKCEQCKQYCAYCKHSGTQLVQKTCSSSDVTHAQVDSFKNVYEAGGYDCSLLREDKKVCDQPSKLNDAVNYYVLQDYYCYPVE
jgi:hypothetical protein